MIWLKPAVRSILELETYPTLDSFFYNLLPCGCFFTISRFLFFPWEYGVVSVKEQTECFCIFVTSDVTSLLIFQYVLWILLYQSLMIIPRLVKTATTRFFFLNQVFSIRVVIRSIECIPRINACEKSASKTFGDSSHLYDLSKCCLDRRTRPFFLILLSTINLYKFSPVSCLDWILINKDLANVEPRTNLL